MFIGESNNANLPIMGGATNGTGLPWPGITDMGLRIE